MTIDTVEEEKIDVNKRVGQYIKLRDVIKKLDDDHKDKMKPFRETLDQLNSVLLDHLNSIGGDSVKSDAGTVYKTVKKSAPVADKEAFMAFVIATGNWDLVDQKANVTAVTDFIEQNGSPPPGVNYNTVNQVGVRRK